MREGSSSSFFIEDRKEDLKKFSYKNGPERKISYILMV